MGINTRADLANYFSELGFSVGAEIGVAQGDFAVILCRAIPDLKYYGIDLWPTEGKIRLHILARYELAKKNLASYNAQLIRKSSLDALDDFADSSLDFVYIDANHMFDYVVNDIIGWTKKVRRGGIVSGHDYTVANTCGVIEAVNGYVHAHALRLHLTTDPTEKLSWWFVKKWHI